MDVAAYKLLIGALVVAFVGLLAVAVRNELRARRAAPRHGDADPNAVPEDEQPWL